MKYSLIILGCLFVAAQGANQKVMEEILAKMKVSADKCLVETGATVDDLDMLTKKLVPPSHEGKCLIFCMSKSLNIQNADGTINKDHDNEPKRLAQQEDPESFEKSKASFLTCADSVTINEDPCITATDLATCWDEENRKKGLNWEFI